MKGPEFQHNIKKDEVKLSSMRFMEDEIKRIMKKGGGSQRDIADMFRRLYNSRSKNLDENLSKMFNFILPQANSIYYDRKVEFINLVEQN